MSATSNLSPAMRLGESGVVSVQQMPARRSVEKGCSSTISSVVRRWPFGLLGYACGRSCRVPTRAQLHVMYARSLPLAGEIPQ